MLLAIKEDMRYVTKQIPVQRQEEKLTMVVNVRHGTYDEMLIDPTEDYDKGRNSLKY